MNLILAIGGILAVAILYVVMPVWLHVYRRVRGPRVVRCPESWLATEIELDAGKAARGAMFGRSTLQVRECARWIDHPGHRGCDQNCLRHVSIEVAQNHGLLLPSSSQAA